MTDLMQLNLYDFNKYREIYPQLTFQEKKLIYYGYYKVFSIQNEFAFDWNFITECFNDLTEQGKKPIKIIELGGYEGRLAYEVMNHKYPVSSWLSLELLSHKIFEGLSNSPFKEQVLSCELWQSQINIKTDLFICIHTLEHYSNSECIKLLDYVKQQKPTYLLIIAPIESEGQKWENYFGAHILTLGSNQIKQILSQNYKLLKEQNPIPEQHKGWCSLWQLK